MLIIILSMQRSGTSDLCKKLCDLQNTHTECLGELFTFSRCKSCYHADPYWYAIDKLKLNHTLNRDTNFSTISNTLKIFNINFRDYENNEKLKYFLLQPEICPVILERHDIKSKYCSLLLARKTHDYSGHVKNGVRFHVHCNLSKSEETSFLKYYQQEHFKWYNWLHNFFRGHFHVKVSFEQNISSPNIHNEIIKRCQLKQ